MPKEVNSDPVMRPSTGDRTVGPENPNASTDKHIAALKEIDRSSEVYMEAAALEKRSEATGAILLLLNDILIEQAERILAQYDAQSPDGIGAEKLQHSTATHLMRMGRMYFDAIYPPWIKTASPANALSCGEAAQRASRCYDKAFQLVRDPLAAIMLSEVYRMAGFSATAHHWLQEAKSATSESPDTKFEDQIRQASAKLKANIQTTDALLSAEDVFPTKDSAGLMLNLQPARSVPSGVSGMDAINSHYGVDTLNGSTPSRSKVPDTISRHPAQFQRPALIQGLVLFAIVLASASGVTMFVQHLSRHNNYNNFIPSNYTTTSSSATSPVARSEETVSYGRSFDFNSQRLSDGDLVGKTVFELDVMRNEPYARHGYKFLRDDLAQYFAKMPWYHPTQSDQDEVAKNFSPLEKRNVDTIRRYEQQHGMVRQQGSVGTVGALASQHSASWFVILGSFPLSERTRCEELLRNVQSHGFSVRIINTSDYPALHHGLLAVVSGPFSKDTALSEKTRMSGTIADAYIKSGT